MLPLMLKCTGKCTTTHHLRMLPELILTTMVQSTIFSSECDEYEMVRVDKVKVRATLEGEKLTLQAA